MTYAAAPARTEISATPSPTNAIAKVGFGKLWDFCTGLFGTTGKPIDALLAMKVLYPAGVYNLAPDFAVATNALTITLKDKGLNSLSVDNPGLVSQRSATLGSGAHNLRAIEANLTLTISSGSTLGHTSARLCPIYIYLIDNAGTQELAVAGTFQGESGIFSTTAEGGGGAADDPNVMYSATARANVPARLAAIAWTIQTTAGTWTAVPSEVKVPPFHLERIGEIVNYGGGTVPYGFYLMDASNQSRTGQAAKLFGRIGTAHGVGDGSTTFGIGDSRRRVLVGSGGSGTGTLGNAVGNTGGAETVALALGEMPNHNHAGSNANTRFDSGGGGFGFTSFNGSAYGVDPASGDSAGTTGVNIAAQGSGTAHNNLQPSLVVTQMIRWIGDI
jgi:microcystin-dependent protein